MKKDRRAVGDNCPDGHVQPITPCQALVEEGKIIITDFERDFNGPPGNKNDRLVGGATKRPRHHQHR